ncbi:type VII secretion system-associated protein [Streptomyces mirabilis]
MANVTVLDSEFLKKFIQQHIEDFSARLVKIAADDTVEGKAISFISKGSRSNTTLDSAKPLIIGGMAGGSGEGGASGGIGGADLNKVIQEAAAEAARVIEAQTTLFGDVDDALWETIDVLNKNQGENLEKITPDDFMDIFEDVDSDLGNSDDESKDKKDK